MPEYKNWLINRHCSYEKECMIPPSFLLLIKAAFIYE